MSGDSGRRHPVGVIHGRFQVLHLDHLNYLLAGAERCQHLVVGITNPDPTHTRPEEADLERDRPHSNPLTYYERYILVRAALREGGLPVERLSVVPFPINLPALYRYYVPLDAVFYLTIYDDWGREKLRRFQELGLDTKVLWERPPAQKGINATEVRRMMALGDDRWEDLVPVSSAALLKQWRVSERLQA